MRTPTSTARSRHWDQVYDLKGAERVSWFQPEPTVSLALIDELHPRLSEPVVDVGAGASTLVDGLLHRGYTDLTVLDVSAHGLRLARQGLGESADRVRWELTDLLQWTPPRRFAVWHDRAVFHFLTDPADRVRYRELAAAAMSPGGHLVLGTFAADGPEQCSGLPVARYHPDQLAAEFGPGFIPVTSRREHHHTPTGAEQRFTWLVLRRAPGRPRSDGDDVDGEGATGCQRTGLAVAAGIGRGPQVGEDGQEQEGQRGGGPIVGGKAG
ncbi:MAG: class I SAM-dependent methyltransferase [Pseudonocardiaceae bacterium]